MIGMAAQQGGECLTVQYQSCGKKLDWQCSEGHVWSATYSNIRWGRWCPECSSGLGERICRSFFEQMFNHKFPKSRPAWLLNDDGYQMELDGYSETLALAFEHQGYQHFRRIRMFQTEKQFIKRRRDDIRKIVLCKQHDITLIEVPQIPDSMPLSQIQNYILAQCHINGYNVPPYSKHVKVTLNEAYCPSARERLQVLQDVASAHGGWCLSPAYLSGRGHHQFCCALGHQWQAVADTVLKGHWCPQCASVERGKARRLHIKEIYAIAKSRGGKCLSQTYVNANTHLLWECEKGHQWKAIPNSIKRGSWCALCSNKRKGLRGSK